MNGETPGFTKKLMVPKDYKPIFTEAAAMADVRKKNPMKMAEAFDISITKIHSSLFNLMFSRLNEKLKGLKMNGNESLKSAEDFISTLELPGHIRRLFEGRTKSRKNGITSINAPEFFDGLTFPFLASTVISAAEFTSSRVMYKSRRMLSDFSGKLNDLKFPQKMLWLTDTFEDGNGVSMFLRHMLDEIKQRELPIDLLVCSDTVKPEEHLVVVKPFGGGHRPVAGDDHKAVAGFLCGGNKLPGGGRGECVHFVVALHSLKLHLIIAGYGVRRVDDYEQRVAGDGGGDFAFG